MTACRTAVAAADGLRRRQRQRYAGSSPSAAADERLLGLDWAVRAGRFVLADRAAQALPSTSGAAQPWRASCDEAADAGTFAAEP